MKLTDRDIKRLAGVKPSLVSVVERCAETTPIRFMVFEGVRSAARQAALYAQGRTKPGKIVTWTLQSKHITGDAVDLYCLDSNGNLAWSVASYELLGKAMFKAAEELGVRIRWGYDWDGDKKLREHGENDGPHFELRG